MTLTPHHVVGTQNGAVKADGQYSVFLIVKVEASLELYRTCRVGPPGIFCSVNSVLEDLRVGSTGDQPEGMEQTRETTESYPDPEGEVARTKDQMERSRQARIPWSYPKGDR